jgi:hypothetical protein
MVMSCHGGFRMRVLVVGSRTLRRFRNDEPQQYDEDAQQMGDISGQSKGVHEHLRLTLSVSVYSIMVVNTVDRDIFPAFRSF